MVDVILDVKEVSTEVLATKVVKVEDWREGDIVTDVDGVTLENLFVDIFVTVRAVEVDTNDDEFVLWSMVLDLVISVILEEIALLGDDSGENRFWVVECIVVLIFCVWSSVVVSACEVVADVVDEVVVLETFLSMLVMGDDMAEESGVFEDEITDDEANEEMDDENADDGELPSDAVVWRSSSINLQ